MMMLYDQGVGIPTTLPVKHPVERWGRFLTNIGRSNDGQMIKAATMMGRTSTGQEHHGRGLQDVLRFVRVWGNGELRILSGRGEYVYRADGSDEVINHKRDLGGTLIYWRVAQPGGENGPGA